jgi:hypothetical protein
LLSFCHRRYQLHIASAIWRAKSRGFSNFGYNGAPTGGFDNLAYLTHVMVNVKPLDHLAFNIFYGHAFGQDIINTQFTATPGNYGFIEAIVSF